MAKIGNQSAVKQNTAQFRQAVEDGFIQKLIDLLGFTIEDLQTTYGVSNSFVRSFATAGQIRFERNTGVKAKRGDRFRTWSDAKWLAMCGVWR